MLRAWAEEETCPFPWWMKNPFMSQWLIAALGAVPSRRQLRICPTH